MTDVDALTIKLTELLRHPEDLDKIPALKSEFTRKKAAVDGQLKVGLKEQLEITQSGMGSITESQRTVNQIKEEMMKIDKLCAESQNMIRDFPNINIVSQIHRNFVQVETMKSNIDTFNERLKDLERLLEEDEHDLENQPNLLNVHHGLTQLRDIRDDAMDQIKKASDASLEATLQDYFIRLEDVVSIFDEHVGAACMNLIPLVQSDNKSMVVRLALIVEEEEKSDMKVKAMQDAQKEYKELASRFKSIKTGPKQLRGYKEKFLKAIELYSQAQFDVSEETVLEDSDKLEKSLKWYFNDLNTVKLGMVGLMPKKWKIFKTYTSIYHQLMHDWLIKLVDDERSSPALILAIINWSEKYYAKMAKFGWSSTDLQPQLLDDRESELVRDWRQLIINSVDEWMGRMSTTDKKSFLDRLPDTLDNDSNGYFRTKTMPDMWRMLREQILVAGNSERADVTEGVLDEMFRALKRRQNYWQKLIDEEAVKYKSPTGDHDGLQVLQDWLVAIANDQISCIDDNEESAQFGYLTRFRRDFEPLVTPKYIMHANTELDSIRDGYVDLGTHCIAAFVSLIFAIDFRSTITEFFTPKWYTEYGMKRITSTFDDYISDYSEVLHHSMLDIFVEELSDSLLIRYLLSVRNKGAKFRRSEPFTDKFKDDVITAFEFFKKFPDFDLIKQKWKVVDYLVRLVEADKTAVPKVYEAFKKEFWDVQLSWIESVLRSRDDFDRSMLSSVKAKAAEIYVERRAETIMSKIK
ncbi:SNARE-binding exocyst subunit S6 [Ptychographa xylographoides]|nr:SNARE-binding exocyst subunit S6 [Ptychographa xylographoides]